MARTLHRTAACLLVASLSVVACGDDDDVRSTAAEDTRTTVEDTTSAAPTSSTAPGELPGERVEIFPYEDAAMAVVGVEADDTLNVRSGPGVDFDVVAELDPLAEGMTATGHNRSLDDGFWAEIDMGDGTVGWANVEYLAQLGRVDDITAEVIDPAGERPRTDTMLQLGQLVADERASDEAPQTEITVVDGPTVGDLGEITVDLLGFGDDAVGGERLHIFGEEGEGGESFVLRTVERTLLCIRGVADDGLCV